MRTKITQLLPADKHNIKTINYKEIYICDWKDHPDKEKNGVMVYDTYPAGIKCVEITNANEINVVFDGFGENAFPIKKGSYCKQCECVLFPEKQDNRWVLFIETKYANDKELAFRKAHDYPRNMVTQIIETVQYFREKGLIDDWQKVHAIASFPNLANDFHDSLYRVLEESEDSPSIEKIKSDYNIIIRGTNSANIISPKRIKLTSNH